MMLPRLKFLCPWLLLAMLSLGHAQPTEEGIHLRGANGKEVLVAGVLEAHPQGAILLMPGSSTPILAPWSKFDLEKLKEDHPKMYYGYLDAQRFNRPFMLKLGVYEGIMDFEESILLLNHELTKPRFYPLPENINYLIEQDANVIRWKERDFNRYNKLMRDYRKDLEVFLRRIYPSESIIIDDSGAVHHKDRADSVDPNRGETSLGLIFTTLADTQRPPSRLGLDYLREVTTFQEDVNKQWDALRVQIPNHAFQDGDINHMKLPTLIDESQGALKHLLHSPDMHQTAQHKLGNIITFVYAHAASYK